jgi:hypothetical protein
MAALVPGARLRLYQPCRLTAFSSLKGGATSGPEALRSISSRQVADFGQTVEPPPRGAHHVKGTTTINHVLHQLSVGRGRELPDPSSATMLFAASCEDGEPQPVLLGGNVPMRYQTVFADAIAPQGGWPLSRVRRPRATMRQLPARDLALSRRASRGHSVVLERLPWDGPTSRGPRGDGGGAPAVRRGGRWHAEYLRH